MCSLNHILYKAILISHIRQCSACRCLFLFILPDFSFLQLGNPLCPNMMQLRQSTLNQRRRAAHDVQQRHTVLLSNSKLAIGRRLHPTINPWAANSHCYNTDRFQESPEDQHSVQVRGSGWRRGIDGKWRKALKDFPLNFDNQGWRRGPRRVSYDVARGLIRIGFKLETNLGWYKWSGDQWLSSDLRIDSRGEQRSSLFTWETLRNMHLKGEIRFVWGGQPT